jgi:RHS repeat-associated protein
VTGAYSYDAFGAVRAHTGASTQWSFTGEQNELNGLEYLRARYYDPAMGRFLTRDPIPSQQPYAYAGSSPANFVDPTGLCVFGLPCPAPLSWIQKGAECVSNPARCAIEALAGSPMDKGLVNVVGALAATLADSPGQDIDKEGGIRLVQNCHSTFCQTVFFLTGMDVGGVTIGNTILAPGPCAPGSRCFAHERTHVSQYRDLGFIGFLLEYFGEQTAANALECLPAGRGFFGCLYSRNALEGQAYDAENP